MFEEKKSSTTPLSSLGEFGLIEKIKEGFPIAQASSKLGIGDDAAVVSIAKTRGVTRAAKGAKSLHLL